MTGAVSLITAFVDLGRGLREGFFMLWETLWALILGFSLSGVVQAFVSRQQMKAKLGNHGPLAVVRASGYGMVSSSCSYAASAMSKSLFEKGADFTSAMIFMFASTNLVVELGIVMLVLLGWQFAIAEFVGGPIMIALLALAGAVVFTAPVVERALGHVRGQYGTNDATSNRDDDDESSPTNNAGRFRSMAAWSDAANYAVADFTMLRQELVIGYVVAGLLAALVPNHLWNLVFIHGHGFWTSLENAMVGPLIAVLSWVCSIGNVPLAAALWSGGISFGGVIAFVFADLISMPLILIYRKLYGGAMTIRMVALFYVVMTIAGLATQGIFHLFGAIPSRRTFSVAAAHFSWNYTTYLNLIFLVVAAGVWWLARQRSRIGGGEGYAIDPVCGMQVRTSEAPARSVHAHQTYYFCADRCRERFEADPERYVGSGGAHEVSVPTDAGVTAIDPVCGMSVDPATAPAHRRHGERDIWFCNVGCAERFDEDPEHFLTPGLAPEGMPVRPTAVVMSKRPVTPTAAIDPVCGMSVDPATAPAHRRHGERDIWFCNVGCAERFDEDPEHFLT